MNTANTANTTKMPNTFYLILHKKTAETDELYNQSIHKSTEIYNNLFKNEFNLIKTSKDTPFQQSQTIALKLFIYGFIVNGKDNIIKHKYQYICKINENIFFNQLLKELFFDAVSSTQRIYNILNLFVYRWKCKRMVSLNTVDLFMNEINDKQKNDINISFFPDGIREEINNFFSGKTLYMFQNEREIVLEFVGMLQKIQFNRFNDVTNIYNFFDGRNKEIFINGHELAPSYLTICRVLSYILNLDDKLRLYIKDDFGKTIINKSITPTLLADIFSKFKGLNQINLINSISKINLLDNSNNIFS
jgi:hypothetical protein